MTNQPPFVQRNAQKYIPVGGGILPHSPHATRLRQACMVRDNEDDYWKVRVCAENKQKAKFYDSGNFLSYGNILWNIKLPLSNETERLIGTTKSYEELIKELDEEM